MMVSTANGSPSDENRHYFGRPLEISPAYSVQPSYLISPSARPTPAASRAPLTTFWDPAILVAR